MNSFRFDAWTRRNVGLATGGLAAFVISAIAPGGLGAKKKGNQKKRKRKKRCKKVTRACKPGNNKRRCCKGLRCGELTDVAGRFCCRPLQATCVTAEECCVGLGCGLVSELPPGTHCCGGSQVPCTEDADCCFNNPCTNGLCED